MEFTLTTKYKVSFRVEFHWTEEGGMGYDQFGGEVHSLDDAIKLWEYAKVIDKKKDWYITCYPEIIGKGK